MSESENRLKEQKEQLNIESEKLRLLIERNVCLERDLLERQDEQDKQLDKRVAKVLDTERRLNK